MWLLLVVGCIFYGWWDWRFLLLLFFTSGVDFFAAKKIHVQTNQAIAKRWLILSVCINLLTLGFFKYYNFFADSFTQFISLFGLKPSLLTIKVILPVGISFYTFQSIAYVTDVYRRRVNPEHSALRYFAFICFFPQMVAGPIERARHMLPQFKKEMRFNRLYFESGINLVLYGFFKKIVIADNLALFVDEIHKDSTTQSWQMLLTGIFAFSIQIYADFSGYSDIARGCARLLGFKLSRNFYFPYFSVSFRQFWQRWHMSLSSWFRDYVYIPLGGSRVNPNRNLLITFLVSGLWHGANYTFILWGFFHGLALMIERRLTNRIGFRFISGLFVFAVVSYLFTLFRCPDIQQFVNYSRHLFLQPVSSADFSLNMLESNYFFLIPFSGFVLLETVKYKKQNPGKSNCNYAVNVSLLFLIVIFAVFENAPRFIYFQF